MASKDRKTMKFKFHVEEHEGEEVTVLEYDEVDDDQEVNVLECDEEIYERRRRIAEVGQLLSQFVQLSRSQASEIKNEENDTGRREGKEDEQHEQNKEGKKNDQDKEGEQDEQDRQNRADLRPIVHRNVVDSDLNPAANKRFKIQIDTT